MDLTGAKILVTGGAGLVGSHIVDELVNEKARVVVYDSFVRGKVEHLDFARTQGDVEIIKADLRDSERMRAASSAASMSTGRSTCRRSRSGA